MRSISKTSSFLQVVFVTIILLSFMSCEKIEPDDSSSGTGGSGYKGTWVRLLGASGDETNIAIGNISGESESRVYMCESRGAVGLYKGYITGNTIEWDASYGLPDARVGLVDGKLTFVYPSVPTSITTSYNRGSWLSRCGPLSIGGSGTTTGSAMFWVASDLGCGPITVQCNSVSKTITGFYGSSPACGVTNSANFTFSPGTYSFSASCSGKTWSGNITVTSNECSKLQLTN